MKKEKSLSVNAVLNILRTVLRVAIPMLIFPHITRALGVDLIGKYNFGNSITMYFVMIAGLGVYRYGVREGTLFRHDREKFSRFASEVFTINLCSTALAYVLLFASLMTVGKLQDYKTVILILSVEILFTTLNIDWIYNVYEDFGFMTVCSTVFQVLTLVLTFVFVRGPEDLELYTAIAKLTIVGTGIFQLIHVRKYCDLRLILTSESVKNHLKPILLLFVVSITYMLYANTDITVLGFFTDDHTVGIYSTSAKIYLLFKQLFEAAFAVMIPRFTLLAGGEENGLRNMFAKTTSYIITILVPSIVGVIMLSRPIIVIIAGEEYAPAVPSLCLLMLATFFALFEYLFVQNVLLPKKKEKIIVAAYVAAAVTNLALNLIFIPLFKDKATIVAALTTIAAEVVVSGLACLASRKYAAISLGVKNIVTITVGCAAIVFCCILSEHFFDNPFLQMGIGIVTSVCAYFAVLVIARDPLCTEIRGILSSRFSSRSASAETNE